MRVEGRARSHLFALGGVLLAQVRRAVFGENRKHVERHLQRELLQQRPTVLCLNFR